MAKCEGILTTCRECRNWFYDSVRDPKCPTCGADRHCQQDAVPGYRFCRFHGGPNPKNNFWGLGRGIVSGKYSNSGLVRLADKYNELMKNGRFLSNQHSLSILRDREVQLLERIDNNEAPDRLAQIEKLWNRYIDQLSSGMEVEAIQTRTAIEDAFEAARTDFAAWSQLLQVLDLDRKMIESEVKIAKEIRAILTAEEGVEMIAKLLAAVITSAGELPLPETERGKFLKRIQYEFTRIIGSDIGEESAEGFGAGVGEVIDA